jgi:hypothetical protein
LFAPGLITLLAYSSLPPTSSGERPSAAMFNDGQVEANTECAWRMTGRTRFAAFVDVDDFLFVRSSTHNLVELLDSFEDENRTRPIG